MERDMSAQQVSNEKHMCGLRLVGVMVMTPDVQTSLKCFRFKTVCRLTRKTR